MQKKIYETELLKCWFDSEGILHAVSKPGERTPEKYNLLFNLFDELSNSGMQKLCLLNDLSQIEDQKSQMLNYVAGNLTRYIKAMAMVSDTQVGKTVGRIFTETNKGPYPCMLFDDYKKAQEWLRQFV
ncbi:MAG TPA: hypothetical protein VD905_04930 [Flavobacteriales bacterium]|nr:hypothetical protein [Flavobacteriales bacterium]